MLSKEKINEIEIIFKIIDRQLINDDFITRIHEYYHDNNYEQWVYLEWLLCRWVLLRNNIDHLPKIIKPIINLNHHL